MFIRSREMSTLHLRYSCLVLLILSSLCLNDAVGHEHTRRRNSLSGSQQAVQDVSEKSSSVPDQVALAAGHTDRNQYRRGGAYSTDGERDYAYSNLEMNLIRPESEPIRTQITAKYTSSIGSGVNPSSLEDTSSAQEYVAKAMQLAYGTRLHEPIRIAAESESESAQPAAQLSSGANSHYAYYQQSAGGSQQSEQQQQQQQVEQPDAKALLEAQMRAQLQAQMQQAQMYGEQQQQQQEQQQLDAQHESNAAAAAAATYQNEQVTRSYEVYDENAASDGASNVDRFYRTKYAYQPSYRSALNEQETEQPRISASTEIPKAEIMKQIEKSVMKYMKELELEGKIVTAPQEPQTYYKLMNAHAEEKQVSASNSKPKYSHRTSTSNYNGDLYGGEVSSTTQKSSAASNSATRHHMPKQSSKQHAYQSVSESSYQAPQQQQQQPQQQQQQQDMSDALSPNVEFVYKLKTRAPLHTATVKTVSKPYTLPLKSAGGYEQFDHSAALKNIEDFDLSHVLSTQDPEERPIATSSKPSKLYFNSEIYQDINSMPYKSEKARAAAAEYRKFKAGELLPDYKGYGGYFAEPAAQTADAEKELTSASDSIDDGYPVMNPYQYVLKKEPLPSKYEESAAASSAASSAYHGKPQYASSTAQKALEYDSYNPKFNNHPEGYGGYQHQNYKSHGAEALHGSHGKYATRHASGGVKRGKRGGNAHAHAIRKGGARGSALEMEANLALRPPPKGNV